ncbi:MAG: CvpA family protein, partial [bacterium]
MLFNLTDVILLVLIASFGVIGFAFGLIRVIGALVGLVLGSWVASVYYLSFAVWINEHLWNFSSATKIIAFILLFGIANRVITFGFYIIGKFFNLLSIIPFLGMINRITGAILGLLEGILVLDLVVYVSFK